MFIRDFTVPCQYSVVSIVQRKVGLFGRGFPRGRGSCVEEQEISTRFDMASLGTNCSHRTRKVDSRCDKTHNIKLYECVRF